MGKGLRNLEQRVRTFVFSHVKLTILIILVLIAGFTFISIEALHFSSDPQFCKQCHPQTSAGPLSEVHTWKTSRHAAAGVKCLDCHGVPGVIGYMKAKMGGLYDVYGEFIKGPEHKMEVLVKASNPKYAANLVSDNTCLFCHSDSGNQKTRSETFMSVGISFRKIDGVVNPEFRTKHGLPDVIAEGVKQGTDVDPKHKKHKEQGISCVECHIKVAHSGVPGSKTQMQTCFDCHDNMRAQNKKPPANEDCMKCHRKEDGIVPKPISFGQGDSAVNFDHSTHTAMAACSECHTKIFPMKKGSSKIGFAEHGAGKYCFSCHTGKKAFSWSKCTDCHSKRVPLPKDPITYRMKDAAPVNFSHEFHTQVFGCEQCHTKVWPMKKGIKKMTMDPMYEGKYCGVCHNEKDAFAATECDKCHIEQKKK